LGFGDEPADVAVANVATDGDPPLPLLARDGRGSFDESNVGELRSAKHADRINRPTRPNLPSSKR
jgi:hypothetical protein